MYVKKELAMNAKIIKNFGMKIMKNEKALNNTKVTHLMRKTLMDCPEALNYFCEKKQKELENDRKRYVKKKQIYYNVKNPFDKNNHLLICYSLIVIFVTIIDFFLFYLLQLLGFEFQVSFLMALATAISINFYLQNKLFGKNDRCMFERIFKFSILAMITFFGGYYLIYQLVIHYNFTPVIAKMITTCVTFIINYFASRFVVFVK